MKGSITSDFVFDVTVAADDAEINYSHDPGRYSGPPENCYPAETEWEVKAFSVRVGTDDDGKGGVDFNRKMGPYEAHAAMLKLLDMIEEKVSERDDEIHALIEKDEPEFPE